MDRKGWIILVLCGIALALNFHFSSKQRKELDEREKDISAREETVDQLTAVHPETGEKDPQHEEKFIELTTQDEEGKDLVKYTFTNKGGGLHGAAFIQQLEAKDGDIVLNKYGKSPIGSLSAGVDKVDNGTYKIASSTDTSVTYVGAFEGVKVIKKWELLKEGDSKAYRLKLKVNIQNTDKDGVFDTSHLSLTSGVAAPLFHKERPNQCFWYYYDNEFEAGDQKPFKDGWFGKKAKTQHTANFKSMEYFGVANQFFTTLISPKESGENYWVTSREIQLEKDKVDDKTRRIYLTGAELPSRSLNKGDAAVTFEYDIYTGPRSYKEVKKLGAHTKKIMRYGGFGFLSPVMSNSINWIHDKIGNNIYKPWSWGISIIVLTIFIRILIWPLIYKSTLISKRMAKLGPEMKELKEKYSDDPQKMQKETMGLYRKYGVNPMAGCLPALLQIPIFFGVFGMLNNAAELRGEAFLWVRDLSQPEAITQVLGINVNILPFLMAGTMVLQMSMMPSTMDKMQKRIFMFMPIMFFFFCYNFASALALYYTVQNILSIGQTWIVKKMPDPELKEKKIDPNKPKKKSMMEKLMEKAEEAQKIREQQMADKTGQPVPKKQQQQGMPGQKSEKKKPRGPRTGG